MPRGTVTAFLADPMTKCVFSFLGVGLERLGDYVDWAIRRIDDGWEFEGLLAVASYCGKEEIPYFELRQDLRLLLSEIGVCPPEGVQAVTLYCLGRLEEMLGPKARPSGLASSPRDVMCELYSVLYDHPELAEFARLSELEILWRAAGDEDYEDVTHEGVMDEFCCEAERLVRCCRIALRKERDTWVVSFVWS